MARTVHRFELVLGVVQFHGLEHVFGIVIRVAGDFPQVAPHDVRCVNERIAAGEILVPHPVFQQLANHAALGMEEDQAGTGEFLNAEKIQFLPQFAMVALLGFFEFVEVLVEFLLSEPGCAVDALQLAVLFVAFPVRTGDG